MTLLAATFYKGIPRWDFGLDNPNKAAAILACALLILLAACLCAPRGKAALLRDRIGRVALLRDRIGRAALVAAAAGVGYCLVHTFSRGGLVAFLAGMLILLVGSWKGPHKFQRWLPILLVALLMAGTATWMGFAGRMARSTPSADASVGNRFVVWRNVPSMMVDAPGGWGLGASGDAFMGWYQPLERHERYRTLVNSHFTWLVEWGWTGRLFHVCGFAFLIALGIVRLRTRGDPLLLAVWTCFTTAAFFSSVAEEWIVWLIPLVMTVPMFKTFVCEATPRMRCVSGAAALLAGCLLLGAGAVVGTMCRDKDALPIHKSYDGTRLVVGEDTPSAWAVCDPAVLGGPAFGRLLRGFAQTPEGRGRTYGLVDGLAAVPDDARHLVLCGQAANLGADALARFTSLADVRVLAPATRAATDKWLAARAKMPCIRVFCGEFAPSCPEDDADGLTVVPGAADYLPDWPRLAFTP